MAAAAILKIHLNGHISVAIAHIRTKFGSDTKTDVPETEILPKFYFRKKNKMATDRHFENT